MSTEIGKQGFVSNRLVTPEIFGDLRKVYAFKERGPYCCVGHSTLACPTNPLCLKASKACQAVEIPIETRGASAFPNSCCIAPVLFRHRFAVGFGATLCLGPHGCGLLAVYVGFPSGPEDLQRRDVRHLPHGRQRQTAGRIAVQHSSGRGQG